MPHDLASSARSCILLTPLEDRPPEVPANLRARLARARLILELEERAARLPMGGTLNVPGRGPPWLGKLGILGPNLANLVALELSGFQPILQSADVVPNVPDAVFNMLLFANRVLLVAIVTPLRFFGVGLCPEGPVEPVLRLVHRLLQPRILCEAAAMVI